MPSLDALAGWEAAVTASLRGATGTIEERDRQITLSGLYAEYPAILRSYLDLVDDERSGLEALKRAVFIVWFGAIEPSPFSGISELPARYVRETMDALESRLRDDALDDELAAMLAWYQGVMPAVFELHGVTALVGRAILGVAHDGWRGRFTPSRFVDRGQLGTYWQSLIVHGAR
jgi:hypothetical protein